MTGEPDITVVRARISELSDRALLTPGEHRRAGAMAAVAARAFVAGRTLLRHLLGRRLAHPIELCEEPDEKPRLAGDAGFDFNVAHGGDLVLVAIARGRRVGVDVEPISERRPVAAIADAALGPDAAELLAMFPAAHRAARFTCWWVRIEAVCKATGAGLVFPIDDTIPAGFAVRDVAVCAGHRAAVAFDGGPARIAMTDWELSMTARPEYYDYTYDMFIASADGEQSEASRFSDWIDAAARDGVYAFEAPRQEAQKPIVRARRADGTQLELLNFSSYNYLGYATHPEVIDAAKAALDRYGLGAASSPVQAGTNELHCELERRLVDVIGLPDRGVSLFSSGYAVNTGTISALMKRRHHLVIDKSAHMSILEGAQLARSKVHYFEHNDVAHLKQILEEIAPTASRILVCTEGVFSADGDFGKLDEIVPLAKSYGARVLVDEAHSFLLCGKHGRGAAEAQGVLDQVDYLVVTFSKALGGIGGALIASREIARYVNWYARCRMFSCALDPAMTAGVTRALELAASSDGADRRGRLDRNATLLRKALGGKVDIGRSTSWIVPVIYGPENLTIPLADWLQRNGLDGSVMSFPAVPVNEARLRLFVTSQHDDAQIARCADIVRRAAVELGFATPERQS